MGRITRSREIAEAVNDVDFVIEAMIEDIALKNDVFRKLNYNSPPNETDRALKLGYTLLMGSHKPFDLVCCRRRAVAYQFVVPQYQKGYHQERVVR